MCHNSQIQNVQQNTIQNPVKNSVFGSRSSLVLRNGDVAKLRPGSNTSHPKPVYEATNSSMKLQ